MDLKVIWTVSWVIKRKLNGDLPPTSLFYFFFISSFNTWGNDLNFLEFDGFDSRVE